MLIIKLLTFFKNNKISLFLNLFLLFIFFISIVTHLGNEVKMQQIIVDMPLLTFLLQFPLIVNIIDYCGISMGISKVNNISSMLLLFLFLLFLFIFIIALLLPSYIFVFIIGTVTMQFVKAYILYTFKEQYIVKNILLGNIQYI